MDFPVHIVLHFFTLTRSAQRSVKRQCIYEPNESKSYDRYAETSTALTTEEYLYSLVNITKGVN